MPVFTDVPPAITIESDNPKYTSLEDFDSVYKPEPNSSTECDENCIPIEMGDENQENVRAIMLYIDEISPDYSDVVAEMLYRYGILFNRYSTLASIYGNYHEELLDISPSKLRSDIYTYKPGGPNLEQGEQTFSQPTEFPTFTWYENGIVQVQSPIDNKVLIELYYPDHKSVNTYKVGSENWYNQMRQMAIAIEFIRWLYQNDPEGLYRITEIFGDKTEREEFENLESFQDYLKRNNKDTAIPKNGQSHKKNRIEYQRIKNAAKGRPNIR